MRRMIVAAMAATVVALGAAPAAQAAIPEVFDGEGDIACEVQEMNGNPWQRWCGTLDTSSRAITWDGMPIDVSVSFPPEPESGPDGPYPLVMMFHGYGGRKATFLEMQRWVNRGYAAFSMTDRGFWQSCGQQPSISDPACEDQYVRLMDTRYEVRDAQYFASLLADEGLVIPDRIAATGGSYGGGMSMALAALKDRTMLPDGTLVPWESPEGLDMSLAVATPNIPWTDLAYSLVPNGNTLDYLRDNPYLGRIGVKKHSYVNLLYNGGAATGRYSPAGLQPANDLAGWKAMLDAGEPYDGNPMAEQMLQEITRFHSSYYIDHSVPPAPLLISNGFTDDLFPADEATRFYNRTRAQFPDTPLALFFGSFGHSRGQNKSDTAQALRDLEFQWVDHYLADDGPQPPSDVTAWTQTCPDPAPSQGYNAPDWASISPGEVRLQAGSAVQTVEPDGGDPAVGAKFDGNALVAPPNTACTTAPGAREPGTANYEIQVPGGGFTMMGSPTVVAKILQAGDDSQIAARLVDVDPSGEKTLIARGLWRPEAAPSSRGFQVFQLHANGWRFEPGHTARLELLPDDASYGRPSNGQQPANVSFVDLRIPVVEDPGAAGGLVKEPSPKVLPERPGADLARGYESIGSIGIAAYANQVDPTCPDGTTGTQPDCRPIPKPGPGAVGSLRVEGGVKVKGRAARLRLSCPAGVASCTDARIEIRGVGGKKRRGLIARRGATGVAPGQTRTVAAKLTRRGRTLFKGRKVRRGGKARTVKGVKRLKVKVVLASADTSSRFTRTAKRVGRVR